MAKNEVLRKIDEVMLRQLEVLEKLEPSDKDFKDLQKKAQSITNVADKIIQSQTVQLKADVWSFNKRLHSLKDGDVKGLSYINCEDDGGEKIEYCEEDN